MLESLSSAQLKVANLALKGLSNLEIGAALGINEKTVKYHLTSVYKKVGAKSRATFITKYVAYKATHSEMVNKLVMRSNSEIQAALVKAAAGSSDPAFPSRVLQLLNLN